MQLRVSLRWSHRRLTHGATVHLCARGEGTRRGIVHLIVRLRMVVPAANLLERRQSGPGPVDPSVGKYYGPPASRHCSRGMIAVIWFRYWGRGQVCRNHGVGWSTNEGRRICMSAIVQEPHRGVGL